VDRVWDYLGCNRSPIPTPNPLPHDRLPIPILIIVRTLSLNTRTQDESFTDFYKTLDIRFLAVYDVVMFGYPVAQQTGHDRRTLKIESDTHIGDRYLAHGDRPTARTLVLHTSDCVKERTGMTDREHQKMRVNLHSW